LFRSYSVLSFLLLFSSLICILGLNWLVSSSCFFSFYSNAFTFYTILYDFLIKPLVLNLCLWWYLDLDECLVLYLNPYPYLYPYFRKAAYIQINKTNIFIIFIILILLFFLLYQYYSILFYKPIQLIHHYTKHPLSISISISTLSYFIYCFNFYYTIWNLQYCRIITQLWEFIQNSRNDPIQFSIAVVVIYKILTTVELFHKWENYFIYYINLYNSGNKRNKKSVYC